MARLCWATAMSASTPYNFICPNPECRAEYVAVQRSDASLHRPKCIECATPFLAMEEGPFIPYEAAWPVPLLLPNHENYRVPET